MTRVEGGRVEFDCLDPLRQRECMERLLCQVCAQPAERADGTLFIEWQHDNEPPMRLNRIRTDMPPLCPPCVPVSLRHCPFLRRDQSAVLLRARKAVPCGVSGTVYQADLKRDRWVPSEDDVYSSYNAPRFPGMLAARLYSKLRGVAVVDPDSLAAELVSTSP
ncbi:hypothetical protein [Streptomyces anulatus]|uniref:hypothetical protein n=1 Tax=Streptomyces anulatus TaxID=1892 RepID=UPI0036558B36